MAGRRRRCVPMRQRCVLRLRRLRLRRSWLLGRELVTVLCKVRSAVASSGGVRPTVATVRQRWPALTSLRMWRSVAGGTARRTMMRCVMELRRTPLGLVREWWTARRLVMRR